MAPAPFLHSAFALTIASAVPLPELPSANGPADVDVILTTLDGPRPDTDSWTVQASPGEASGWAPGAGRFRVRGGREIALDLAPGADDRAIRLAIVGPLLGVILSQRGRFVLHASTVLIDDCAVAFSGPSGRGKSTLVAALANAGHPLIADDMTVIDTSGSQPFVQPGFPRVKLWPDAADVVAGDAGELPLLHPDRTKRSLQIADRFRPEPAPLARCYLLEDGVAEAVSEIAGSELILSLVRATYQASWMHETGAAGSNFVQCAALAQSGVVRRLQRRRRFDVLRDVVRFIERDVRSR